MNRRRDPPRDLLIFRGPGEGGVSPFRVVRGSGGGKSPFGSVDNSLVVLPVAPLGNLVQWAMPRLSAHVPPTSVSASQIKKIQKTVHVNYLGTLSLLTIVMNVLFFRWCCVETIIAKLLVCCV